VGGVSRKIYLASSWRNDRQPHMVAALRAEGYEVYDFKNPAPDKAGFAWKDAGDVSNIANYLETLKHPVAQAGFKSDFEAMQWADTFVLLLPCGRSAHLEMGWATGRGLDTHIVLSQDQFEPELMYLQATAIHPVPLSCLNALRK
jgi:hypothetical protein